MWRTQMESLETRQVMTATPIAGLSDEFTETTSINNWNEVHQTEGWGARGAQLNQWTVNANGDGQMVMQPHSVVWYADWRGPLVFKEVTGDFVVTTRIQITDHDNIGGSDADNVPGDGQFSLGGLMIRTPRDITSGAADWQPGSGADDGTNNGENYVFLSMGYTIVARSRLAVRDLRKRIARLRCSESAAVLTRFECRARSHAQPAHVRRLSNAAGRSP